MIEKILAHLGLKPQPPPKPTARGPPGFAPTCALLGPEEWALKFLARPAAATKPAASWIGICISFRCACNRDIRSRLTGTGWLRARASDPKKASAKVGRCFRRLHAHGLIARIPRTRRWRVTAYGRQAMGTSPCLREHDFPNAYTNAAAG